MELRKKLNLKKFGQREKNRGNMAVRSVKMKLKMRKQFERGNSSSSSKKSDYVLTNTLSQFISQKSIDKPVRTEKGLKRIGVKKRSDSLYHKIMNKTTNFFGKDQHVGKNEIREKSKGIIGNYFIRE